MVYQGIRTQMFNAGWISRPLYEAGAISIDLYYLFINNVEVCRQDPYYLLTGYFDKVTVESQIDAFIYVIQEERKEPNVCKRTLKHLVDQLNLLRAIATIKIEQSN